MAYTAAEPLAETRILLNDVSASIYTDAKLLPLMQKAYRELQQEMQLNGLSVLKEATGAVTVTAGTTFLGDGAGLPDDFVYPIELAERNVGSSDNYVPMDERMWEPDVRQDRSLLYWVWREEQIKLLGATSDREVRLRYMKGLTRITAAGTPISIIGAETYLASRTAAVAALVLGSNPTRAAALNTDAQDGKATLIALLVKRSQGNPIRRRVNRYRR